MHEFDRRLHQLLDSVADLTDSRRQRLARSLRQDDVELGVRVADASLDAAMKAALRVAAHEVLDVFCMHLEGALARCRSDHARTLVMAIVAIAHAEHACVLFQSGEQETGLEFTAAETLLIAPAPYSAVDLELTLRAAKAIKLVSIVITSEQADANSTCIAVSKGEIEVDVYQAAAEVLTHLRATT